MFWNKTVSPEAKAERLGQCLIEGVPPIASFLLTRLREQRGIRPTREQCQQFLLELFVIYMHLLDRMAFGSLGVEGRERFTNRLIVVVSNGVMTALNSNVSAVDVIARFRDIFNVRQKQYERYKVPSNATGEPLQALFWAFGESLLEVTLDHNPVTLSTLALSLMDCTSVLLGDALNAAQVLAS